MSARKVTRTEPITVPPFFSLIHTSCVCKRGNGTLPKRYIQLKSHTIYNFVNKIWIRIKK